LVAIPGIGSRLAATLEALVTTGEFRAPNSHDGDSQAEQLLMSLPGVGPRLARACHERLGLNTLEEFEQAAHDGRLSALGVGPKRLRGLIDALAGRFSRSRVFEQMLGEPSVADLLAVDKEYRASSQRNRLTMLPPRRFNRAHEPWLPLFNTLRNGWRFRAEYSNNALAHRLGQTRDWVAIYFTDGHTTGQRTVVSETHGNLSGRRVVRGREEECRELYRTPVAEDQPA
jgi:hypothetical protein